MTSAFLWDTTTDIEDAVAGNTDAEQDVESEMDGITSREEGSSGLHVPPLAREA